MNSNIMDYETEMWDAALKRDKTVFSRLVSPEAVMICGGYRCSGAEYAGFISDFDLTSYKILELETITETESETLIHYVIEVKAESSDLSGTFHVASVWRKTEMGAVLVFNMDSRICG